MQRKALEPGIDRFGFKGEDSENAFTHGGRALAAQAA
jgi:hypothetical protein